jgi:site-specific recombinase XerD
VSLVPLPGRVGRPGLVRVPDAVSRFLKTIQSTTTRDSYAETLTRLIEIVGSGRGPANLVIALDCDHYAAAMSCWADADDATWNRHLSALTSFTAWAQRRQLLDTNPARRLEERPGPSPGSARSAT